MKKAILYIRVSNGSPQAYSQKYQQESLCDFCEINEVEILETFIEHHSSNTYKRPAPVFNEMLLKLKSGSLKPNYLFFTHWDRFSRNASETFEMISTLTKMGIELLAVDQE